MEGDRGLVTPERETATAALRFASYLAPNMWPVYMFIAEYVGGELGLAAPLVVGTSFDQFAAGEVDVGFV